MANPSIKETVFFISPCVTNTEVKIFFFNKIRVGRGGFELSSLKIFYLRCNTELLFI